MKSTNQDKELALITPQAKLLREALSHISDGNELLQGKTKSEFIAERVEEYNETLVTLLTTGIPAIEAQDRAREILFTGIQQPESDDQLIDEENDNIVFNPSFNVKA